MNWQTLFGNSGTANWILLTAFHSLWLSLVAYLFLHIPKLRAPTVRSTWCTFALIVLLILPLTTWLIPRTAMRAQPDQKTSVTTSAAIANSKTPLLNDLLGMQTPLPQARINQWKVLMNQFGFLWFAVMLGCVGRLLYDLAFLKGYCNGLQEVEDDRISVLLREIQKSFGFRKVPRIYVSPRLTSPISLGMQTPLVILPAGLYQKIGDGELRAILLHELAHVYHHDHILGLLQRFIKALYWWNPLVYCLCNALSVAREEVSDNYAISGMDSAASYATLLVSLVEKTSLINRVPCTAGMATPYESLETRIKNLVSEDRDMRVKTNKGMISAIAVAAVFFCGLVIVGSQVKVFGTEQAFSSEVAKPIVVNINRTDADFNMDLLNGYVFDLEAADGNKYQSSPIHVNGDYGYCEFSEPLPPGYYKLVARMLAVNRDVVIPPTPNTVVTLNMNIAHRGISIYVDLVVRNELVANPQRAPIQLEESNAPAILSRIEAEYPPDARAIKLSGIAKVEVFVNEGGEVYEARLLNGHPMFNQPALDAVKQWKFEPLSVNGELKSFVTTVTINFHF